jgi:CheY-like chemotaxis protein
MRIAYVEDNPTNLALVERVASMNRHAVVSYAEGEIAAEELLHEQFDLILMDVELAGEMGGLQVVRNLRQAGVMTPIIAVTAYAMLGDRERCLEAGCNGYLPKPLPIAELLVLLAKYDAETKAKSAEPAAVTAVPTSPAGSAAPTTSTAASATSTAPVTPANPAPEIKPEVAKAPEPTTSAPAGPAMPAPPMANTPPATVPMPSVPPRPGVAPSVLSVPGAKAESVAVPINTLPTSTPGPTMPSTPEIKPDSAKTSEPAADVQSTPGESAQSPASTPEQRTP